MVRDRPSSWCPQRHAIRPLHARLLSRLAPLGCTGTGPPSATQQAPPAALTEGRQSPGRGHPTKKAALDGRPRNATNKAAVVKRQAKDGLSDQPRLELPNDRQGPKRKSRPVWVAP
jgi:hypothetical protein